MDTTTKMTLSQFVAAAAALEAAAAKKHPGDRASLLGSAAYLRWIVGA